MRSWRSSTRSAATDDALCREQRGRILAPRRAAGRRGAPAAGVCVHRVRFRADAARVRPRLPLGRGDGPATLPGCRSSTIAAAVGVGAVERIPGWDRHHGPRAPPIPREPVRALDALHLATVLRIGDFRPGLGVLSFDRRIRANAAAWDSTCYPPTRPTPASRRDGVMTEMIFEVTSGDADAERVDGGATAQDRRRSENAIAGLKPYSAYRSLPRRWRTTRSSTSRMRIRNSTRFSRSSAQPALERRDGRADPCSGGGRIP